LDNCCISFLANCDLAGHLLILRQRLYGTDREIRR
jgi:hypothetical protein